MKKGQSGMNAAVLIAVILGLIVLYVVFLPTSEREKFFFNKTSAEIRSDAEGDILLQEFPKRLDKVDKIDTKEIPNIFLLKSTEGSEIERINPFTVRNGVFDKKGKSLSFTIDDVENTDNVILSFNAKKHKGTLMISLNGDVIYEKEITSEIVDPVRLKKNLLSKDNTLEFSVSSVGMKFWSTNEYSLENIRILGDITDVSRQKSQNVFSITQTEYNNLEQARLRFIPYCSRVSDVGMLEIDVNNHNIFSAVPVCDDPYKQVIPLGTLDSGENYIVFKTGKGSYSIEQIELEFEVEETSKKVYYFEINESTKEEIDESDRDIRIFLEFVDDDEDKVADISINGRLPIRLDQEESGFDASIETKIVEGNNYIEIRPKTTLEIRELKVQIVDKD